MQSGSENNALVEIALALSMAFFSLMVLTMMSMSAGGAGQEYGPVNQFDKVSLERDGLSITNASSPKLSGGKSAHVTAIKPERMAIYYNDKLYDAELNPLVVRDLQSKQIKYLAVAPDLSMQKALAVRDQIGSASLVVTILNAAWLKTLKEKIK